MTLPQVLAELKLDTDPALLAPHWGDDLATLPDVPELLKPEVFLALRDYCHIAPAADPVLAEVAAEIRDNPALKALFWHCYNLLVRHLDYEGGQTRQWPVLDGVLGDRWGAFYLLLSLGVIPIMRAKHQALGIPDEITRGVAGNYEELVCMFQALYPGQWGADLRVLYWLRNDSEGLLYRLGRMEYMHKPFHGRLLAFRHRRTGEVVALSEAGVTYTEEGYVGEEGWAATLEMDEQSARGTLMQPAGHALREIVELPLSEWDCVLRRGDHILETHIPGGGGFLPDLVRDSMRRAAEFWPRYFPHQPFVGLACASWMLNPRWHEVYRPDNNVTAWQREMYLYPLRPSGRDGVFFLFGREDIDPATAPRDTSMRRAMLDWLAAGKRLMAGGSFMLTEHLDGYGSQVYRHQPRFR